MEMVKDLLPLRVYGRCHHLFEVEVGKYRRTRYAGYIYPSSAGDVVSTSHVITSTLRPQKGKTTAYSIVWFIWS
jgi:hypothetical protein